MKTKGPIIAKFSTPCSLSPWSIPGSLGNKYHFKPQGRYEKLSQQLVPNYPRATPKQLTPKQLQDPRPLMPVTTLSGLIAIVFYLIGTFYQAKHLNMREKHQASYRWVFLFGLLAVLAHFVSVRGVLHHNDGYHFGIVQISTLITATISLLVLLSGLRKPLGILILGLFPLAILSIVVSLSIPSAFPPVSLGAGIASHILLSILAYSLFSIAALQAGFLAFQNHQLKHRHAASVIRRFPPLQDMESFLFELLWAGQGLLTLGIVAGFFFVDDIWAHGLLHKMFFSVLAWGVFAVLLWGRHKLGWRGTTAIRFTLTGFAFLILGFYGSKVVLEYILN